VTRNDVLRRLRYAFDFSDSRVIGLFELGGRAVSGDQIRAWMKKEEEPSFQALSRKDLAAFLDGLIADRRGKREGAAPAAPVALTNNVVLRKLRIALSFQEADMLEIMSLTDMPISRAELSALFRRTDHRNYKECQDQLLRNFLTGLQYKFRGKPDQVSAED
jgi:uncharacterized protein YehS (DUF1456 family)